MSTRIARIIAVAVSATALAAPTSAPAASLDLRGEFAKGASVTHETPGADLRGEFAQSAGSAQAEPGLDVRGEFAKSDYRADTPTVSTAPIVDVEPAGSPSELPYVVSGLVALLGLGALAIVVATRRRVRVGH